MDYVLLLEGGVVRSLQKSQDFFKVAEEDNNLLHRLRNEIQQQLHTTAESTSASNTEVSG